PDHESADGTPARAETGRSSRGDQSSGTWRHSSEAARSARRGGGVADDWLPYTVPRASFGSTMVCLVVTCTVSVWRTTPPPTCPCAPVCTAVGCGACADGPAASCVRNCSTCERSPSTVSCSATTFSPNALCVARAATV